MYLCINKMHVRVPTIKQHTRFGGQFFLEDQIFFIFYFFSLLHTISFHCALFTCIYRVIFKHAHPFSMLKSWVRTNPESLIRRDCFPTLGFFVPHKEYRAITLTIYLFIYFFQIEIPFLFRESNYHIQFVLLTYLM